MTDLDAICQDFEKKLSLFRAEVSSAEDCYYLQKTIHGLILKNDKIYAELYRNGFFWQSVLNAARDNLIGTLSRIFTRRQKDFSIGELLKTCRLHREIFSKAELRKRKSKDLSPDVLVNILRDIPEEPASEDDIMLLEKQIESCTDIFDKNYREIRDEFSAQRDLKFLGKEGELASGAAVGEIEAILDLLDRVHSSLYMLYYNGFPLDVNVAESTNFKYKLIKQTESVLLTLTK